MYLREKRSFKKIYEGSFNSVCHDYPGVWNCKYTPRGMARAVASMYGCDRGNSGLNFIACYSSMFIPRVTAGVLTPIAKRIEWQTNDYAIVDFI
jgi:hypothetical protein